MNDFVVSYLYAIVALFVIIDPISVGVLFAGMTQLDSPAERLTIARRSCLIGLIVLAVFGLAGEGLLRLLGISIPALRIAGGVLLFLSAASMVSAPAEIRAANEDGSPKPRAPDDDISVFPLAIPWIAGPGAMTWMVLLHSKAAGSLYAIAGLEGALLTLIAATFIAMLSARTLSRLLGDTSAHVIGRVFGVLTAAMAAQFVIEGVRQAFHIA
jgi:multiple antibiotic resistance protein